MLQGAVSKQRTVTHSALPMQAGPSDPESFPFVVLGNKVDMDEGKNRQVCQPQPLQTP